MRTRLFFAMPIALAAVVIIGGVALATPAVGLTSTPIANGTLDPVNIHVKNGDWMTKLQIKGQSSVSVVQNTVVPGGTFGWHSHPGPSLIIVKSGTITFYHGDDPTCTPDVKHAGDALIDDGTDVHVGRNEGTTDVGRHRDQVPAARRTHPDRRARLRLLRLLTVLSCAPAGVGAQDTPSLAGRPSNCVRRAAPSHPSYSSPDQPRACSSR